MPIEHAISAEDSPYGFASEDAYHRVAICRIDLMALHATVTVYSYIDAAAASNGLSPVAVQDYTISGTDFSDIFAPSAFSVVHNPYAAVDTWLLTQPDFAGGTIVA